MKFPLKLAICAVIIGAVTAVEKKNSKEGGKEKFSKYSKETNVPRSERPTKISEPEADNKDDYRPPKNYATTSERLFKMQKIQNVWQKGQKVS